MGINARFSDAPTAQIIAITVEREEREAALRDRVRAGEIPLLVYLTEYKGYSAEHAARLEPQFRAAIFGN